MICGVDEAGRGPVIGPLVVAGVAIENPELLEKLNVRNSKKCTPKRREKLAVEIMKIAKSELIIMPAEEIDILRAEMSLNRIEAKLFATVIEKLNPSIAYVDSADADELIFKKLIAEEIGTRTEIVSKHMADEIYPIVSAASIIAKVKRDEEVRKIEIEIRQPIGSGYPADPLTMEFLENWIKTHGDFPPYTRKTWETAQRIFNKVKGKPLNAF